MTDHAPGSRVGLDGRRVVVDLSDVDRDRLATMTARSGVSGPELVLGWIRRGLLDGPARDARAWDGPVDRGTRQTGDTRAARGVRQPRGDEAARGGRQPRDTQADRAARRARDVEVARQAEEAFRDLLGGPDRTG